MRELDRITFDPKVMQGQACIRSMRIPVSLVLSLLAHKKSKEDILCEYQDLEPEDIRQSLIYASRLAREIPMDKGKVINPVSGRIEIRPGYAGGEPHIKGRRIKVRNIVYWHKRMGLTLDEIAYEYSVGLTDIHAALAYYYTHRDAIDRDIRDQEAFDEALEKAPTQEAKRKLVASYVWPDRYGSTPTKTSPEPS